MQRDLPSGAAPLASKHFGPSGPKPPKLPKMPDAQPTKPVEFHPRLPSHPGPPDRTAPEIKSASDDPNVDPPIPYESGSADGRVPGAGRPVSAASASARFCTSA